MTVVAVILCGQCAAANDRPEPDREIASLIVTGPHTGPAPTTGCHLCGTTADDWHTGTALERHVARAIGRRHITNIRKTSLAGTTGSRRPARPPTTRCPTCGR